MTTSLVTGGAGFIGSHVVDDLVRRGHEVVALDDLSGGFAENVPAGATFVQGSILDVPLLERLFSERRFRFVYHLAAYAAEGLSHFIRRFNYSNNLIGSVNLLNAAVNHGTECFVFTSSIAVYGSGQTPMTEALHPLPEDPYGIAKLAVEQDLRAAHEMFGLEYVVFRPHNVYGERQNIGDRYRNVVGIFMNQLLQGKPMTIFGDGEQQRAFTYIDDIAPIIGGAPLVPAARNQVFNLGSDEPLTVNRLASAVAEALEVPCRVEHLEARKEVQVAFSDHEKTRRIFGAARHTPIEEGLRLTAEWVRAHGARAASVFDEIEIPRGLPPAWTVGVPRRGPV